MKTIHQIVRDAEQNYTEGTTKRGKYVDYSMYEIIETINAYTNNTHTSGKEDSLGREKPFFNIVTAAENIWYRATDLDRKNVKIIPKKNAQVVPAFIASTLLQNWMDETRFGVFLNKWGRTLARYGSAIVEFVEKDGQLIPTVNTWDKFIPDPVDFDAIPRIKKFYKTIEQLKKIDQYDQDVVKRLEEALTNRKNLEGHNIDNQDNFIEIYEVHGDLPDYLLDDEPEEPKDGKTNYQWQMHTVCFMLNNEGKFDDYTLFKGKKKQDTHMITHLIEEEGRTLAQGAVEYLFDAQWMTNHSIKQWKDQMDLASKLIFQTSDANYQNRNVLSAIETGDIMVHADNKPLTLINNQGHDITSIQGFIGQWKILGQEITSTPDAVRGNTLPAGTPYSLGAYTGAQALSLFEIMTENKGFSVEDMLKRFVIPHLKKKVKGNKDEIVALLNSQGINEIDAMYIPLEAVRRFNKRTIKQVLEMKPEDVANGAIPSPFMPEIEEQGVKDSLTSMGNKRFFKPDELDQKTWDKIIDDEIWDNLTYEITNENTDKQATLTTLSSIFQVLAGINPQKAELVLDKIMLETGAVTPLELSSRPTQTPPAPAPTGGGEALSNLTTTNG